MIFNRISDNIPLQMKILNNVIPILMHFCNFTQIRALQAACYPMKCDVIYDVRQFQTVYHRIYFSKFFIVSNQTLGYKIKCIKIGNMLISSAAFF